MPLGTNGHHYFLLLSRRVCEGIFLSRLGQNENDDSINLGGSPALDLVPAPLCCLRWYPQNQLRQICRALSPSSLELASSGSHEFSSVPDFSPVVLT